MNIIDIIEKKKKGLELTLEEVSFFVFGYINKNIEDCQASALLMAICLKGFTSNETYYLTKCMIESGERLTFNLKDKVIDKHSTGGVADTVTLILMPMISATAGYAVAKMSGRGLGFTGGTIDKLESILNYNVEIDKQDFIDNVEKNKISVISQMNEMCIADKMLYALRDITATIDSIPLIAASIMCKKIACGSNFILLDVKCGSGAFMKNKNDAIKLANCMVQLGKKFNMKVVAAISSMDEPLGSFIGNKLEIYEAIQILNNIKKGKLYNLCLDYYALIISNIENIPLKNAKEQGIQILKSGKAYNKFLELIKSQHGDINCLNEKYLINTQNVFEYKTNKAGYLSKIDALTLGKLFVEIGGGRLKKGEIIDYNVGIELLKHKNDYVNEGEIIAKVYYNDKEKFNENMLDKAFEITDLKGKRIALIANVINERS